MNRWDPLGLMRDGLQHGNFVLHHLFAMLMRICTNQPYTHTHTLSTYYIYLYSYIYIYIYIIKHKYFFLQSQSIWDWPWQDGGMGTGIHRFNKQWMFFIIWLTMTDFMSWNELKFKVNNWNWKMTCYDLQRFIYINTKDGDTAFSST